MKCGMMSWGDQLDVGHMYRFVLYIIILKDIEILLINELEGKSIDTTEQDFIYNGTMYMDRISKDEIKDIKEDFFELRKISIIDCEK